MLTANLQEFIDSYSNEWPDGGEWGWEVAMLEAVRDEEATGELSMQNEEIKSLKAQIRQLEQQLAVAKRGCQHMDIQQVGEGVKCNECGEYFGWYCPQSPDFTCHYYSRDGKIKLINGNTVNTPSGHMPHYETDDDCIYCHSPEERK